MSEPLSMDQAFIEKLSGIVLSNLQNQNFGVNELAHVAGLSRSVIHRRLRAKKDQNITQFIREIRLKRAMELLQQHSGPASDVAYKVGFGSPAYFNKCFHEYYGYPPGEVKLRNLLEDHDASEPEHMLAGVKKAPANRKRVNRKVLLIMAAVVLAVMAITMIFINGPRYGSRDLSIIVLPFKNLSNNPDNQYIADGLMEDILNNLYHISDLSVKSRTTSEHYRGTTLTLREIAHEIKVRNVLEGSIRRQDDTMRFSIQIIDARRDKHLWSANYDRGLNDILGIQGEIALHVANKLKAMISDNEAKQISELPTKNSEAYDYYLKGRFLLHRSVNEQRTDIDKEGLMGSLQYFEKAITADVNFAAAYAGLAQAYFDLAAWGWMPVKEGFLKAKELSLKALEIDSDCAEAHAVLGAFHGWGDRQFEEARTFIDRALELEPYFWVLHNLNAYIYYFEGKHREALQACQIARDMKEDYLLNSWLFFLNYAKLGEGEKAMEELQKIVRTGSDSTNYDDEITKVYQKSGIDGVFEWMIDININRPIPVFGLSGEPFFISWWYAILGDNEKSIYLLERNMEQKVKRHAFFDLIGTNPDFDILRDDPRFLAIIEKIGLAPYHTRKGK